MNKEILKFLSQNSSDTELINKILISSFVKSNNLRVKKNELILNLIVNDKNQKYTEFLDIYFRHNHNIDFADLIQLFEHSVPKTDKTINGIVYTPKVIKSYITNQIFDRLEKSPEDSTFCDLSCGCGGFLYTLAKKLKNINCSYSSIFKKNLYGLDIKDYSISRAKILLSLLAISEGEDRKLYDFNLFVGNALEFDWFETIPKLAKNDGFDSIVGNPPYVTLRNINEDSRRLLKNWSVAKNGNTDLYIPFFEIGDKYLKEGGIIGFITVNSFFRTLNARTLRQFFQLKSYDFKIIDFGHAQLFGNRATYSCICIIKKTKSKYVNYSKASFDTLCSNKKLEFVRINYQNLDYLRGWVLSPEQTLNKIKKIESTGEKLTKRYKMKTGLATLANHIYIFKPVEKDDRCFYLTKDQKTYSIEKNICRDVVNPNQIKSKLELANPPEQIIFPYLLIKNKLELLEEDYFKAKYPGTYAYLSEYKELLSERDKGKGNYKNWFAYGRNQSLTDRGYKLLFPHITTNPYFFISKNKDLLFYNGHAIYADSIKELEILKKILESDVFKYYINNTSKPYTNGYFSLSKNYIKHFGLCDLSIDDKKHLIECQDPKRINNLILDLYDLKPDDLNT